MTVTEHFGSKEAAAGTAKQDSPCPPAPTGKRPNLKTRRIGLVSRNYWEKLPRKNDFSGVLKRVLAFLDSDAQKCDSRKTAGLPCALQTCGLHLRNIDAN